MKAFYVLVLVLVAGTVPSHGRTESEGTVFNKTLPHESMNNVTVSSIKSVPYDYLLLAMQWPKSFCNSRPTYRQCHQQVPDRFTVHGLWPQNNQNNPAMPPPPIDCTKNRNYPPFVSSQLDRSLVFGLNQYWPNLLTTEYYNYIFWESQYNKHGSCTFANETDYFYHSLTTVASLGDLTLKLSLRRRGPIIPGDIPYLPDDIRDAVREVTSIRPRLNCIIVGNRILLSEIRFCAFPDPNGIRLVDCNLHSDCRTRNQPVQAVYLPRP